MNKMEKYLSRIRSKWIADTVIRTIEKSREKGSSMDGDQVCSACRNQIVNEIGTEIDRVEHIIKSAKAGDSVEMMGDTSVGYIQKILPGLRVARDLVEKQHIQ